ncbi:rifin, partial [Plasmodium reichenowi]
KVHYINILLFALPLNILAHNKNKPSITHHTHTNRSLCELYAPANYDNDPQMKDVMDNFNKQTQQRFHEYDDRMKTTRQKCKEQCDKEIQKIILKDKLEKQMAQQLTTLETKINTDDIPTCVCEKSVADKTEKFCLNCGKNMGAIAPSWGLVCGIGYSGWEIAATAAATQKGIEAGINVVIDTLKTLLNIKGITDLEWKTLITAQNYTDKSLVGEVIRKLGSTLCGGPEERGGEFCLFTYKSQTLTNAINGHDSGWEIAATAAATQKGIEAGINVVIDTLKTLLNIKGITDLEWKTLITAQNYTDKSLVGEVIRKLGSTLCGGPEERGGEFCLFTYKSQTLTNAI